MAIPRHYSDKEWEPSKPGSVPEVSTLAGLVPGRNIRGVITTDDFLSVNR